MMLRCLAPIVPLAFVAGLVSATTGEAWRAAAGGERVSHTDGAPCPDPSDDGHPCPACACTCCPGHAAGVAFAVQPFEFGLPPANEFEVSANDDLHLEDVHFRIFHPPRV